MLVQPTHVACTASSETQELAESLLGPEKNLNKPWIHPAIPLGLLGFVPAISLSQTREVLRRAAQPGKRVLMWCTPITTVNPTPPRPKQARFHHHPEMPPPGPPSPSPSSCTARQNLTCISWCWNQMQHYWAGVGFHNGPRQLTSSCKYALRTFANFWASTGTAAPVPRTNALLSEEKKICLDKIMTSKGTSTGCWWTSAGCWCVQEYWTLTHHLKSQILYYFCMAWFYCWESLYICVDAEMEANFNSCLSKKSIIGVWNWVLSYPFNPVMANL